MGEVVGAGEGGVFAICVRGDAVCVWRSEVEGKRFSFWSKRAALDVSRVSSGALTMRLLECNFASFGLTTAIDDVGEGQEQVQLLPPSSLDMMIVGDIKAIRSIRLYIVWRAHEWVSNSPDVVRHV